MKESSIEQDINRINYIFEFQKKMSCQYVLQVNDTEAIKHLLSEYRRLQKENEMKDKILNKMAEYIASGDIDEDVCRKVTNGKFCNNYEKNSNCKECVIEYFKRAVRKDG